MGREGKYLVQSLENDKTELRRPFPGIEGNLKKIYIYPENIERSTEESQEVGVGEMG